MSLEVAWMSKPGQMVLVALRKMIASGELAAGERLMEVPTAELFGVSRMPVRMAFRTLEQEGLLVRFGGRGFQVRSVSADDIAGAVEVRGVLEGWPRARLQSVVCRCKHARRCSSAWSMATSCSTRAS